MVAFVCILYCISLLGCAVGMYNGRYNANFLQRVALAILALWFAGRVVMVIKFGWAYPHEPFIALALALLALGTLIKTIHYRRNGT